jgi:hypothetical protein
MFIVISLFENTEAPLEFCKIILSYLEIKGDVEILH